MGVAANFIMSVAGSALIFSIIMFIVPREGSGKTARIAAAVFMLAVIIRSAADAAKGAEGIFGEKNEQTPVDGDSYVCMQAELAIEEVISDRLNAAGCNFDSIEAEVEYENGGFTHMSIYVSLPTAEDEAAAQEVAKGLNIDFNITVTQDAEGLP